MEPESGSRETAGRVVVEKEVMKEALAELLNKIPAFKALVSGRACFRQGGWVEAPIQYTKKAQRRLMAEMKLVSVRIVRHQAELATSQAPLK